jgi:ABC-2 type transport system permease protein
MATANNTLIPVAENGWRRGFGNLFRSENSLRWGKNRWIMSALIWLVILNGFVFLVAYGEAESGDSTPAEIATECIAIFMTFGTIATAVGVVTGAQGAIIREKQLGTAAWVLSKPVSRSAFVLAKMLSYSLAYLTLPLILTSLVFYGQSQMLWGQTPPQPAFLAGWSVMALHMFFYVSFTLMLGTLFNARAPVSAIGLGFLFGGQIFPNFLPQSVMLIFPWKLSELAPALALGQPLPPVWPIPVIATAAWTIVFIAIALWRFSCEEF